MPSASHPHEDDGAHQPDPTERPSGDGCMGQQRRRLGALSRPRRTPPRALADTYYLGRSADGARQGIGVAESDDPEWRE